MRAMIVWNSNPLVIVPNAEARSSRHGPRRPLHRRARTVPHRHREVRRHRAARPPPRSRRTTSRRRGATSGWAGTRRRSSRSASRSATRECFRRIAGAMGLTEPSLFDDDLTVLRDVVADRRHRRAAARRLAEGAVPRGRDAVGRGRLPDRRRARSSSHRPRSSAMGQPRLPDVRAADRGARRARTPLASHCS